MGGPDSVKMPGQVWGLAAPDPAGPVFVTSYDGHNLNTTVLVAVDPTGTVHWRHEFDGHPGPPRASADGTVWIAHRGPAGHTITQVGTDGSVLRSITPDQQPHEHLGAFVVLPDGLCVAWLPAARSHLVPPGGTPRLARYSDTGSTTWSTALNLDQVSFPGVVEMGRHTGGQVQPMKPWTPRTIEVDHWQPLLVSSDRALVGVTDGSSGIGICTILDTVTGQVIATTEPAPHHHKAIAGPDRFLIGRQGYGAFSSTLYDREGRAIQNWPSHGMMLVDRHGTIRGPESENRLPSRSLFRVLNHDGSLRDGPPLSGYYTAYPALDANGTAVFWRDGRLLVIDSGLKMQELFTRDDQRAVMSRVLLLDHGQILLALDDELLMFRNTGLAALDTGYWPCADGNIHGNPVAGLP
jgi:hypothetical protein